MLLCATSSSCSDRFQASLDKSSFMYCLDAALLVNHASTSVQASFRRLRATRAEAVLPNVSSSPRHHRLCHSRRSRSCMPLSITSYSPRVTVVASWLLFVTAPLRGLSVSVLKWMPASDHTSRMLHGHDESLLRLPFISKCKCQYNAQFENLDTKKVEI